MFASGDAQRLLALGGLLLVIAGMIFGDIFAVFILHPNNALIGQAMAGAAEAVAQQDAASIMERFKTVGHLMENRGTKVDAHSHIIQFGYLAFLLALAQPYVALSSETRYRLAQVFLVGAVLLPPSVFLIHYVGLAYSPLQSIGWASIAADFGGFLVIVACMGELVGLWRFARGRTPEAGGYKLICDSWESRVLLRGGALLLVAGFIFGAYYAATRVAQLSLREVEILGALLESAAQSDMGAVEKGFAAFGMVMAEKAIKVATHAHVNEVGMLLLLLAFIQPFVQWSARWKRRWVCVAITGAVGLPVSILLELKFGLLAGGFADFSGLLLIVALTAMLFGLLRHTGYLDAKEENRG